MSEGPDTSTNGSKKPMSREDGVGLGIIAAFLAIVLIAYGYTQTWAGFAEQRGPQLAANEQYQRGKTLWDWMQLILIPLLLAVAAYLFNQWGKAREQQRADVDREIARDDRHETLLQGYLDQMSELLLKEKLGKEGMDSSVWAIARARTVAIMQRLDSKRNRTVVSFLHETGLIGCEDPIIRRADLRGVKRVRLT